MLPSGEREDHGKQVHKQSWFLDLKISVSLYIYYWYVYYTEVHVPYETRAFCVNVSVKTQKQICFHACSFCCIVQRMLW